MSKSNVNPSHYKVAGRERQGEDIAQELNKQKLAESVVSRRTEPGAGHRQPASQDAASLPPATAASPRLTTKLAAQKASSDAQKPGKRTKRSTGSKG